MEKKVFLALMIITAIVALAGCMQANISGQAVGIKSGYVTVTSIPDDATVYLSKNAGSFVKIGTTNLKAYPLDTKTNYVIMIKKAGYKDFQSGKFTVVSGSIKTIHASMTKLSGNNTNTTEAFLTVTSNPTGADVHLQYGKDGKSKSFAGTTNFYKKAYDTRNSPYKITIRKDGFKDFVTSVYLQPGKETTIVANLEKEISTETKTGGLKVPAVDAQTGKPIEGADVYVDGIHAGLTPLSMSGVRVGQRAIVVKTSEYEVLEGLVTINADRTTVFTAKLISSKPQVKFGKIKVDATNAMTGTLVGAADVFINGVNKGFTPLFLDSVAQGDYSIVVKKAGYNSAEGKISVTAGQTSYYKAALVESTGDLLVTAYAKKEATEAFVKVSGDGVYREGTTPVTFADLKPGAYKISVSKAGFADFTDTVKVESGVTTKVEANLY